MRFRFPLEGLLHVRQLVERQARDRLDESLMRIHALEHSLREAQRWSTNTARVLASRSFLPACELQFAESLLRKSKDAIQQCTGRKHEEERRAAELRAIYLQARRDRKTVSTLRDDALRKFQLEQARHEQSALDEMFLGKFVFERNVQSVDGTGTNTMTGI